MPSKKRGTHPPETASTKRQKQMDPKRQKKSLPELRCDYEQLLKHKTECLQFLQGEQSAQLGPLFSKSSNWDLESAEKRFALLEKMIQTGKKPFFTDVIGVLGKYVRSAVAKAPPPPTSVPLRIGSEESDDEAAFLAALDGQPSTTQRSLPSPILSFGSIPVLPAAALTSPIVFGSSTAPAPPPPSPSTSLAAAAAKGSNAGQHATLAAEVAKAATNARESKKLVMTKLSLMDDNLWLQAEPIWTVLLQVIPRVAAQPLQVAPDDAPVKDAWRKVGMQHGISTFNRKACRAMAAYLNLDREGDGADLHSYFSALDRKIGNGNRRLALYAFLQEQGAGLSGLTHLPQVQRNRAVFEQLVDYRDNHRHKVLPFPKSYPISYADYTGFVAYVWAMHVTLVAAGDSTADWKNVFTKAASLEDAWKEVARLFPTIDKTQFFLWDSK